MNKIITLVAVAVVIIGGYFYLNNSTMSSLSKTVVAPSDATPTFAPEIKKILDEEKVTIQSLANEQTIVEETRIANERDKGITETERIKLDNTWINSKEVTPFMRAFLENKTALFLLAFQKTHPGYKEIFISDAYGLNVGQTNKTSDYYQADESWWKDSFNNGDGKLLNGNVEFDESSQTESIPILAPVLDPLTGKAIGVLKAVLDVTSLVNKL